MKKRRYIPPELEVLKITMLMDVLSLSTGDINHDIVDQGDGDDLFNDETDPDINHDDYDLGDFDPFG